MKKIIALFIIICVFSVVYSETIKPVKNLILISADGLSLSNKTITRIFKAGPYGSMNIDRLENTGYNTNHSADFWISDSASNSSAISTLFKTENGRVSVLPNGDIKSNFFEKLSILDKKTGIVTNGSITNAAVAPYYAHAESYKDESNILEYLFKRKVDVIFCGGEKVFLPQEENGIRTDNRNFIQEAQGFGYRLVSDKESLAKFSFSEKVLGIFAHGDLPYYIEKDENIPNLKELSIKALDLLSKSKEGFVLLIENSNLRKSLDQLDVKTSVEEIKCIDDIIGKAIEFAEKDKDTLILLISGFDSGSLRVSADFNPMVYDNVNGSVKRLASQITSTGANLDEVMGVYAGINLNSTERNFIQNGLNTSFFIQRISTVLNNRAGVLCSPYDIINKRSATVTPVWAGGKHSELFKGFRDNTETGNLIQKLIGIK